MPEETENTCKHRIRIVTARGTDARGNKLQNWKCVNCKHRWQSPRK